MRLGFSLVELSIVLVILGLLTGGILTGQNLIRAAELRKTLSQFSEIKTATMQFREKYFYLPGDIPNASDFGMQEPIERPGVTRGNGRIESSNGSIEYSRRVGGVEQTHFFYHLREKGLMPGGGYTPGTHRVSPNTTDAMRQQFLPTAMDAAAIWLPYRDSWDCSDLSWDVNPHCFGMWNENAFSIMRHDAPESGSGIYRVSPAFTPEEAWQIDTKLDDGMPNTGMIHGVHAYNNFLNVRDSNGTTSCAQDIDGTISYEVSFSGVACGLVFNAGF